MGMAADEDIDIHLTGYCIQRVEITGGNAPNAWVTEAHALWALEARTDAHV
jgi:hypothetical protein